MPPKCKKTGKEIRKKSDLVASFNEHVKGMNVEPIKIDKGKKEKKKKVKISNPTAQSKE